MGEEKLLREIATNLLKDAREAKREGNYKLAKKLMEGARRVDGWHSEGLPESLR